MADTNFPSSILSTPPTSPAPSAPLEDIDDQPWDLSKLAREIISSTGFFIATYPYVALGFAVLVVYNFHATLLIILSWLFPSTPKAPRSLTPPLLPDFAKATTIIPPAMPSFNPMQRPYGATSFRDLR